jgi:hypothetical protein
MRPVALLVMLAATAFCADVDGIWTGQQPGRNGQVDDVAFRFKVDGATLTGKLLGDEFDLPIAGASVAGDRIRFIVTTANYYSGGKVQWLYTGTFHGGEMELARERVQTPDDVAAKRPPTKTMLKLKRIA